MKILRVVSLGSATGKYGGPFDTAVSQARLTGQTGKFRTALLVGHLPGDRPSVSDESFEFVSQRVHRFGVKAGFSSCMSWGLFSELVRRVRHADLVHISYARELIPLAAAALAVIYRKPMVIQPHGMMTARTSRLHKLVDLVALPLFRQADQVIALTHVEKAHLEAWAGPKATTGISILGNPLPYAAGEQPTKGGDKVFFVARLEPRKRVCDFVEARRIALSNGWDDAYEVVGPDQGDGPAVRAAAASTPGLNYRGAVPASEIGDILHEAGVFVLTSENEPWGNVLVAALARDIPVVVTRSAALAEEIERNHLGIVVPDRAPGAVAEAVHQILTGQWRTQDESNHAKVFSSTRFDQVAIRERLADIYQSTRSA